MGSILTLASAKGGAGKTTTTIVVAANLVAKGYRVCVVDSDRNQSFVSWHDNAYEGAPITTVSEVDHIRVVDIAGEQAESHDIVLVDTAGFENLTAASAIGMADFVLIPCMPDRGSVRETLRTAQQVASLSKAARRAIPYSVLLTRWKAKGLAERAALDSLTDASLPIIGQSLSDLSEYAKLSFSGAVPVTGKVGEQASSIIAELASKGAIPTKGTMSHSEDNGVAA